MPQIAFVKDIQPISIEPGADLMRALLDHGLPVASSCHGKGVCSKCKVIVVKGSENVSAESRHETELRARNKIPDGCRISCQSKVNGDIIIDTTYW